jgi:hypothetical protein
MLSLTHQGFRGRSGPESQPVKEAMRDDEIDIICDWLIRLAMVATATSRTSGYPPQQGALETAVVSLEPSTREVIVEQLTSPGRLQRISDWTRLQPLLRSDLAVAGRYSELATAMAREAAVEIVWRCLRAHCP